MAQPTRCLLVYPEFTLPSFWNFRATCTLQGAKYPSVPLGMLTIAAMLPSDWELRVVDCNVEPLTDDDFRAADLVFVGGMLPQQASALRVIDRAQRFGKAVVVGGPDATSSPQIYDRAEYQVLGEAEVTLPHWLADYRQGTAAHCYLQGADRADVSKTPVPRFDLIKLSRYLYPSVQFSRGCPFLCEFCDIIELFGRVPRLKPTEQMLHELQSLYDLGHRGHVEFVDDNFVGNKRDVKKFLPHLIAWQEAHDWPFEFSTEASINLADDDELLGLMQAAGFCVVFVGIESPDEATLAQMQKRQNTKRELSASIHRIYEYGMIVLTGYIVGFDNEPAGIDDAILELIESSATPVNMVGLLFALPGTQLTRRLQREGRISGDFATMPDTWEAGGDQCAFGINFEPTRPRIGILRDLRKIIDESYQPNRYFERVQRVASKLNCSGRRLKLGWRKHVRDSIGLVRLIWRQGIVAPYRRYFWQTVWRTLRANPPALRDAVKLMGLYLHFHDFAPSAVAQLSKGIDAELRNSTPVASLPISTAAAVPA